MTSRTMPPAADRVCRMVKRESLGGSYSMLTFESAEVSKAQAGQFAMIQPAVHADVTLRRPFSIMDTDPAEGRFSIFLKAIGPGSRAVADLREGESARVLGPLGHGFTPPFADERVFLVGGGYGVAPFALFSQGLNRDRANYRLFYGGRSAAELPLVEELEKRGMAITLSTDDGTRGEKGRVTAPLIAALDAEHGKARLYACGPEPMMHAVARIALERKIPCEVSLDPWMGCGLGTCLGCVVKIQEPGESKPKNRPACTEGPVFDSTRVIWGHH
ncbi:MAG: dihydroorotate dehydrogenase electron transfer subunit [Vicinamibacteria bacterium]